MNALTLTSPTMTSREIADLTGKAYTQVIHDTFEMLCNLEADFFAYGDFAESADGAPQVLQGCFRLPGNLLCILAGSYGHEAAAAIHDEWREREASAANMAGHVADLITKQAALIEANTQLLSENRQTEDSGTHWLRTALRDEANDKKRLRRLRVTYVVRHPLSGLIKIGRAVDPAVRIANLGTQSGARLEVLQLIYADCESQLHKRFASIRVHGEWFKDDGQIRTFCASLNTEAVSQSALSNTTETT